MFKLNKLITLVLVFYLILSCLNYTYAIAIDDSNMSSCFSLVEEYCAANNIDITDYLITSDGFIYVLTSDNSSLYVNRLWDGNFFNSTNCMIFEITSDTTYKIPVANSNGSNYTQIDANEGCYIVYCSFELLDSNGDVYYSPVPAFTNPYVANTAEDLASGTFDYLLIMSGSLTSSDSLGIEINKVNYVETDLDGDGVTEQTSTFECIYETQLTGLYGVLGTDEFWYELPSSELAINFTEGTTYVIELVNDVNKIYLDETYILYDQIQFTVGGLTEDDKEANRVNSLIASNNKTTEAIKENTETNKNIFEKIGEILSFINPFSDNFFGKILVDLILDGLKSLFVPSEDFFTNWFDDLNSWLGDRFGILYFPVEIVLDFLNRVGGLSETTNYTLTVPEFKLRFLGYEATLFHGYTYDFNELLANETFKNVHTVYLTIVDVILYLCLIVLSYNIFVDVFGGHYIDDALHDVYDYAEGQKIENNKRTIGFNTGGNR